MNELQNKSLFIYVYCFDEQYNQVNIVVVILLIKYCKWFLLIGEIIFFCSFLVVGFGGVGVELCIFFC